MSRSSTGTVTVLFTDMVGSTELFQRLGDDDAERVRRGHFELLSQAVADAGGRQVKSTGDGLMAVFPSALDAVHCAVAIQQGVAANDAAIGGAAAVRVGLNAGEAIEDEGDYHGTAVNVAARLCQAAQGGQIVVSDLVRGLVGSRGGQRFRNLGSLELKGLAEPVAAWEVLWREREAEPSLPDGRRKPFDAEQLRRMPLPPALVETAGTTFVGRAEDLAVLDRVWGGIAQGGQRLALVAGEPGIGKTRLCAEFCSRIHSDGAIVLYGRSDEETILPYQPFVESLTALLAATDDAQLPALLGNSAAEMSRMVPELEDRLPGLQVPRVVDAEADRYRLFEAVTGVLGKVASATPVVLVLDDLHWTDKPSLLLLRHLARSPRASRLLILGTYRETDLDRRHPLSETLTDLRRDQRYQRILLRGLSADEVREFMEAAAGHAFSGRGLSIPEAIHRETEGNPFFIGEVVAHMVETGKFFQREGVWVFDTRGADLGIPEGVRDVVTRRLARLTGACNQVLAQASVLGREFEFDVLASMVGSDDEALAAIEETLERSLLVEVADRKSPTYAFTHSLVRQSLYEEISLPRKQKLHLRAAEAIERAHHRDLRPYVAALSVHYRNAGTAADPGKAIDYSIEAGRAAYSSAAYEEAVIHLEAALEIIEDEDTLRERRGEALELLGDLMYITGADRRRGIKCLEEALVTYQAEERVDRVIQVQSKLGRGYSGFTDTMDIPRAREHYRAAEALVSGLPDSVPIGYLHLGIAGAALFGARTRESLEAAERAVAIAEATGNDALWANAASIKGFCLAESGRPAAGVELGENAWQVADRANHVTAAFFTTWMLISMWWNMRDFAAALTGVRRELATERSRQNPEQRGILTASLSTVLVHFGDLEAARQLDRGGPVTARVVTAQAWLAYADGGWERAASIAVDVARDAMACGDIAGAWTGQSILGRARIAQGDPAGARTAIEEGIDFRNEAGSAQRKSWAGPVLARICLDAGDVERAVELIELVRSAHESLETAGAIGSRLAEVDAEIALAQGDEDRARQLFTESIAAYGPYPEPFSEAEFRFRWSIQLRDRGDRAGADEQLEAARQIYTRIGAGQPWIDRLERSGASPGQRR